MIETLLICCVAFLLVWNIALHHGIDKIIVKHDLMVMYIHEMQYPAIADALQRIEKLEASNGR